MGFCEWGFRDVSWEGLEVVWGISVFFWGLGEVWVEGVGFECIEGCF